MRYVAWKAEGESVKLCSDIGGPIRMRRVSSHFQEVQLVSRKGVQF